MPEAQVAHFRNLTHLEALEHAVAVVLGDITRLGGMPVFQDEPERRFFAAAMADAIWSELDAADVKADLVEGGVTREQVAEAVLRGLGASRRVLN